MGLLVFDVENHQPRWHIPGQVLVSFFLILPLNAKSPPPHIRWKAATASTPHQNHAAFIALREGQPEGRKWGQVGVRHAR